MAARVWQASGLPIGLTQHPVFSGAVSLKRSYCWAVPYGGPSIVRRTYKELFSASVRAGCHHVALDLGSACIGCRRAVQNGLAHVGDGVPTALPIQNVI